MTCLEIPKSDFKTKLPDNLVFYCKPNFYQIRDIMDTLSALNIFPKDILHEIGKQILNVWKYPIKSYKISNFINKEYDIYPDAYLVNSKNLNFNPKFFDNEWKYLLSFPFDPIDLYKYPCNDALIILIFDVFHGKIRQFIDIKDYTIQPLFLSERMNYKLNYGIYYYFFYL